MQVKKGTIDGWNSISLVGYVQFGTMLIKNLFNRCVFAFLKYI